MEKTGIEATLNIKQNQIQNAFLKTKIKLINESNCTLSVETPQTTILNDRAACNLIVYP